MCVQVFWDILGAGLSRSKTESSLFGYLQPSLLLDLDDSFAIAGRARR